MSVAAYPAARSLVTVRGVQSAAGAIGVAVVGYARMDISLVE
jgi:hypothetical protein